MIQLDWDERKINEGLLITERRYNMENAFRAWFEKIHAYIVAGDLNMFVIYDSTNALYGYEHYDKENQKPYKYRHVISEFSNVDREAMFNVLQEALGKSPYFIFARLRKGSRGIRIRFAEEDYLKVFKLSVLKDALEKCLAAIPKTNNVLWAAQKPVVDNDKPSSRIIGEKKMNDFSLTNLRDAFINKVTHLDRKTVMIIAIIALLLLIAGKYTTIKDILKGIKDKVTRSKNYKAMVEDGTNAVNSLKKIIGIKGEVKDEA